MTRALPWLAGLAAIVLPALALAAAPDQAPAWAGLVKVPEGSSWIETALVALSVLTLLALRMEQQGVDPGDAEGLARVNRQVARETGHLTR